MRQQSRGGPPTYMQQQQSDNTAKLTAREQEHVAKMTGMPLVSVPARSRTPDPSVGLIGAIEAREQEKRNIKDGVSGQMVQAAIAQRQQHERQQSYGAPSQAQYAAQMAYGGYQGQQQQSYGRQQIHPQQQSYGSYASSQQVPWPPNQFVQQDHGQVPFYGQPLPQQSHWPQGPQPNHQQRYSGYYGPDSGQQDPYRR